jgi:hypothetical protein
VWKSAAKTQQFFGKQVSKNAWVLKQQWMCKKHESVLHGMLGEFLIFDVEMVSATNQYIGNHID